jgi:hypothetical protein
VVTLSQRLSPQPFDIFLRAQASLKFEEVRDRPDAAVESATTFDEMRTYLLDKYNGARVDTSFVENDGQIIDCIPYELHPNAASDGANPPLPEPPPAPEPEYNDEASPLHAATATVSIQNQLPPPLHRETLKGWPTGTSPLYRTTLEQLTRYPNLAAFLAKPGLTVDRAPRIDAPYERRYATCDDRTRCLGGASRINAWKPFVTPLKQGSISQQWYSAVTGDVYQSVECGWHVDPPRYNYSYDPHLFVYATNRTHENGHYWFNLEGGKFHLVGNPYVTPGAPLLSSQIDGSQIEYKMGFYLTGGKWWFYFDDHAIGYYEVAELFPNGPLASGADEAEFGGEVARKRNEPFAFPAMGSGRFAADGFGKAAYQRQAFLHHASGGAFQAELRSTGSPLPCYSLQVTNHSVDPNWGSYFFFGGQGALSC